MIRLKKWGIALILLSAMSPLVWKGVFYKEKPYFEVLPVRLTRSNLPCIDIKIEGESYPFMIDLGSRFGLCMDDEALASLNKTRRGLEVSRNFRGTKFKRLKYVLPKVEIGSLIFKRPVVTSLSKEQRDASIIYLKEGAEKLPSERVGDVGRKLLKEVNLLFDINQAVIIATNDRDRLAKEGYEIESFVKLPFKQIYKGIILRVKTDLGELRLGLDTGSTWTLLHDYLYPEDREKKVGYHGLPIMTTNKCVINGTDLGPQNLAFIKMTNKLRDIDGFLGMDFIQNHVIYVDFSKKVLYIQPPKG